MIFTKKIILSCFFMMLVACANYKTDNIKKKTEKIYYISKGFALVYEDKLYTQEVINKKIDNEDLIVMHSSLKKNTPIKIINPENSKVFETKIYKKANYPKIFNIVISKQIALILELNIDNPYVEVLETKKNKTFIAKESNTFDEEKKAVDTVPVKEITMDDLTEEKPIKKKELIKETNFVIVISDFYYLDSANNLKDQLTKEMGDNNFLVKKIANNKYRLSAGPFKNFNALKVTYISLNNLGFEDLNIYTE